MPKATNRARKRNTRIVPALARAGYAAKGFIYILLASMVWRAADTGHRAGNTRRALGEIDDGSFHSVAILLAIAIGLGGYALWKLYIAAFNPERDGFMKRLGALFIAGINGGLAAQALMLVLSSRNVNDGDQAMHWSAVVMGFPLGIIAIGITGVCVAGYGLRQAYRGVESDLDDQLSLGKLDRRTRWWAAFVARIGLVARGFVFTLIGIFLVRSALRANPAEAKDFGDSIQQLRGHPFGHLAMLFTAAGLFAYATYEFLRARYRVIPTHK
jgi:hypothetical protein